MAAARDRADDAEIRTRLYRLYGLCAEAKIPELTRAQRASSGFITAQLPG